MTSQPAPFGEAIRAARTARGWTQQRLADELHVKRASVSLWESGQMPGPLNLAALREVLGASLVEPLPPLASDELAYWRGHVDAVRKYAEGVVDMLASLSTKMEHRRDEDIARQFAQEHVRTPPIGTQSVPRQAGHAAPDTAPRRRKRRGGSA